jgi:hypothetical protein
LLKSSRVPWTMSSVRLCGPKIAIAGIRMQWARQVLCNCSQYILRNTYFNTIGRLHFYGADPSQSFGGSPDQLIWMNMSKSKSAMPTRNRIPNGMKQFPTFIIFSIQFTLLHLASLTFNDSLSYHVWMLFFNDVLPLKKKTSMNRHRLENNECVCSTSLCESHICFYNAFQIFVLI